MPQTDVHACASPAFHFVEVYHTLLWTLGCSVIVRSSKDKVFTNTANLQGLGGGGTDWPQRFLCRFRNRRVRILFGRPLVGIHPSTATIPRDRGFPRLPKASQPHSIMDDGAVLVADNDPMATNDDTTTASSCKTIKPPRINLNGA